MKKCRDIVKALRYKTGDFHKISEDPQSRFDESDDESDEESDDESDGESDEDDERPGANQPHKQKSLKLDVVTRWYSQLFMLESLVAMGRLFINTALEKYATLLFKYLHSIVSWLD